MNLNIIPNASCVSFYTEKLERNDKRENSNHKPYGTLSLFARSLIFGNRFAKKVQKAACICSLHRPPRHQESNQENNKSLVGPTNSFPQLSLHMTRCRELQQKKMVLCKKYCQSHYTGWIMWVSSLTPILKMEK